MPATLLASFAMKASSCNPDTVGGAGEQGLMQSTKDKCGEAPNGNCKDPVSLSVKFGSLRHNNIRLQNYNIQTGAKFSLKLRRTARATYRCL